MSFTGTWSASFRVAGAVRIHRVRGAGGLGVGGDARAVEEGSASARDDVERLADRAPLVVVEVSGEEEDAIALEAQATRREHPRAGIVAVTVRHGRIAGDEEDGAMRILLPELREVGPLAEIDAAELAVCAPQIEPRRERQREIARLLDRLVAAEHEAAPALDCGAAKERADGLEEPDEKAVEAPDLVEVDRPCDEADLATGRFRSRLPSRGVVSWSSARNGSSMRRRKRRPNPSRPSYQSWLPGAPRSTRFFELAPTLRSSSFHGSTRRL